MSKFQILIKNNENTGSIDYRQVLVRENIKLLPKSGTDGLSIFIIADLSTTYLLKDKYEWILDILKCSNSVKIPYVNKCKSINNRIKVI